MEYVYIAYGSNLHPDEIQKRCPHARFLTTGILADHQLIYKGNKERAYLDVETQKGSQVPVALYALSEKELPAMDAYEEYPVLYVRVEATVDTQEGPKKGFFYQMTPGQKRSLPQEEYVKVCQKGYQYFHFDPAYLDEAWERTQNDLF